MKKFLFLTLLFVSVLPSTVLADDGKVCQVEGGSVQAEVTNSPVAKETNVSNIYEYEVFFNLMNSSPNYVNATYVIRDNKNKECMKARVFVEPQKEVQKKAVVRTNSKYATFVVDIVGADCKTVTNPKNEEQ